MEDKKTLDNEELEKIIGGTRIICGIVMECSCGVKIYETNPTRTDENGFMEIQCTQCGKWHRLQY